MLHTFLALRSPKIHCQRATLVTSKRFTFFPGYVYQKDERAQTGNLSSYKFCSPL